MEATVVFEQIWDAIHELNEDGTRKWRYFVLEGSSRSSKTRSLIQAFYLYCKQNKKKRCSVWRDTAKDCRDTVGNDMEKIYPDMEGYSTVNYHSTKSIYRFHTKSNIEICGTDDALKVHGYQGDVAWFNEPYKIGRDTFDQIDMRCEDFVVLDWNPKQAHFIDDIKKDPRCLVLKSTFKDNPFCPQEQKVKILGYQPAIHSEVVESKLLTESEARQYDLIENPLLFTEKQIKELARCRANEAKRSANSFNWQVYGLGLKAEKPNRIFRFKEIDLERYLEIKGHIHYGVDWGAVDPWGILESKFYDGALYLRQLNYLSENQWRDKLSSTEQSMIEADDAGKFATEKTGIVKYVFSKFNIPYDAPIDCDYNRTTKILALRDLGWEYAVSALKPAGSIMDGIDLLNDIEVYYTSDSTDLKYEQENYSRKVDRSGTVLDEPEEDNNHLLDPARYIALRLRAEGML